MYGASQANKRSQALLDAVRKRLLDKAVTEQKDEETKEEDDGGMDDDDDMLVVQSDPCAQEHHFHRFGGIGVMFVDMRGKHSLFF